MRAPANSVFPWNLLGEDWYLDCNPGRHLELPESKDPRERKLRITWSLCFMQPLEQQCPLCAQCSGLAGHLLVSEK